jgi:hypothetical protein
MHGIRIKIGIHCIGGWVGPHGWSEWVQKILPLPGFNPWTIQPLASNYTDCAILVLFILTLSDPMSDLVQHYDFPGPDAFPHVVRTLVNR